MKPILFNTEMVRAILDGRKSQTRRVINLKKFDVDTFVDNGKIYRHEQQQGIPDGSGGFEVEHEHVDITMSQSKYQIGDILYVRETFGEYYSMCNHGGFCDCEPKIVYKAGKNHLYDIDCIKKWKPSIHMPKEMARIFLHITNVRVERLQDISHDDIYAEGLDWKDFECDNGQSKNDVFQWWQTLWNSTAKDGYKWEDNPYVFVYEFERIEKPC